MKKRTILSLLLAPFLCYSSAHDIGINELVVDPQQDHDGNGKLTSLDEYIELYNSSTNSSYNLSGWSFYLIDSTPERMTLGTNVLGPRSFLVIQNPRGEQNNNGKIELYDEQGYLVDSVRYGNWDDGSGFLSGIPNGNASGLFNESLSRYPDGSTNWVKTFSSRGAPNVIPDILRPQLSIERTNDFFRINSSGVPGKIFALERSEDLSSWLGVCTNSSAGDALSFDDSVTNTVTRFYRAREQ